MVEHSINAPFTRFASRLNSFRGSPPQRSPHEALLLLSTVPGITATELNYPQHFAGPHDETLISAAQDLNLAVTAINLRFDPPAFIAGSFTHPEPAVRDRAIELAHQAVEIATRHQIGHVILWLGPDGYDYPFQADYARLWAWAVDGARSVAARNPDLLVSIEPKPFDPRRQSLVRTSADALLLARDTGTTNVGITVDVCHALMAGENPAVAASLALREDRLFGLHLNDGYGPADDGLMAGSVHPVLLLELLWVLKSSRWAGTIYFDTFPGELDPVAECAANIATVKRMVAALDRVNIDEIRAIQARQDGPGAVALAQRLLLS
jgi:sugar phosphate isomerase/epimerase